MIGIIGGTHLLDLRIGFEELNLETPFGTAEVDVGKIEEAEVAIVRRHGRKKDKPPHKVNHAANFFALKMLGVEFAIGMGSVGCLREDLEVPAIIIPHDYIDLFSGVTVYDKELVHVTPGFDDYVRKKLIEAARKISTFPVIERGIYFQTRGPRLETKAEIAMMKNFADCVGMTAGSEATVAKELGVRYAVICTMDNYAHGIKGAEVDYREIVEKARKNAEICLKVVEEAVRSIWIEKYKNK